MDYNTNQNGFDPNNNGQNNFNSNNLNQTDMNNMNQNYVNPNPVDQNYSNPNTVNQNFVDSNNMNQGYTNPTNVNPGYTNPGYTNPNVSNQGYTTQYNTNQGGSNKGKIALIVVILVVVGLVGLGLYLINSGEVLYGKWECVSGTNIELNKNKTFRMYDVDGSYEVTGNMKITEKSQDGEVLKYTISLESNSIVFDGEKQDYNKTNTYNVTMNASNTKSLTMQNPETYSSLTCSKK